MDSGRARLLKLLIIERLVHYLHGGWWFRPLNLVDLHSNDLLQNLFLFLLWKEVMVRSLPRADILKVGQRLCHGYPWQRILPRRYRAVSRLNIVFILFDPFRGAGPLNLRGRTSKHWCSIILDLAGECNLNGLFLGLVVDWSVLDRSKPRFLCVPGVFISTPVFKSLLLTDRVSGA